MTSFGPDCAEPMAVASIISPAPRLAWRRPRVLRGARRVRARSPGAAPAPVASRPPSSPSRVTVCRGFVEVPSAACQATPGGRARCSSPATCSPRARCSAAARSSSTRPAASPASAATAQRRPPARPPITCPTASISPGLINTHDHITFTQNAPVHRHRRALRAPPRLAQRPARPHRASTSPAAPARDADPLGRAALPDGRRDLDRRLGQRQRACCATSTAPQPGGPRPDAGRLRDLPARRHATAPQLARGCGYPSIRHRGDHRRRRRLPAAHRRGHRRRRAQRVPLPQLDRDDTAAPRTSSQPQTAFIHGDRPHRARLRR